MRRRSPFSSTMTAFAARLLEGPLPLARLRQGQKLFRLGERYSAERLAAACRRALEVDLIDVRRVERILTEALEQEATPEQQQPPPGRFARPAPSSPNAVPLTPQITLEHDHDRYSR